jgi:hypothetical protein
MPPDIFIFIISLDHYEKEHKNHSQDGKTMHAKAYSANDFPIS